MIGELAALGAALSWTVSATLYKEVLLETNPASANIARLASTSVILLVFLVAIDKLDILTNLPVHAVILASVSGIIGLGLGDTFYMMSLKLIGVARAVPITCIYPLFNIMWALYFKKEPVTLPIVVGALIIVLGIWLLGQKEKKLDMLEKKTLTKGIVFALATAVMWSVSISMIDMAVSQSETQSLDNALAINTVRIIAIAFSLLALSPLIDRNFGFVRMQRKTLAMLILGGIVALGLGWFFLTFSFAHTSEARAVPISSTTPLFSTLSGILVLREKMTTKNIIGSIIIVLGIFLVFMLPSA